MNSKNTRCDLFMSKRMFTESRSVSSSRFVLGDSFLQRDRDFWSQGPLDLRLSTGNSYDDNALDDEEMNLSLSIGRTTYKRSKINSKTNVDAKPVFWLGQSFKKSTDHLTPCSSHFLMNNGNFHQDHMKVDPSYMKRESSKNGDFYQECGFFNQGSKPCHEFKKSILLDLDLNKSQPDESSFTSNEPLGEATISSNFKKNQEESQTSTKDDQTKASTTVRNAALSLISISLQQTSTTNQDSKSKKKTIARSSSIDSYESLVLKLEESSVEEDSATSTAFEINESLDQKGNGIKLKRGSRLKDFQKDILPIISSLSQHEILEDINILEGVIRSREYKRLHKAKTVKGENKWFKPSRNKRSKVSYVGRRYCLHK